MCKICYLKEKLYCRIKGFIESNNLIIDNINMIIEMREDELHETVKNKLEYSLELLKNEIECCHCANKLSHHDFKLSECCNNFYCGNCLKHKFKNYKEEKYNCPVCGSTLDIYEND